VEAGAGMERAGAERHGQSPEGVRERERANQSNRCVERNPRYPENPSTGVEAGAGIEPANSGFADRDLTTWLPRRFAQAVIIECGRMVSICASKVNGDQ
jgi:hypothetical protein